MAVGKALEQRGFRVVPASDGREALEKLLDPNQKIDLVLLDLTLPGVSGREVLVEVRKLKPDARILLTSAHHVDAWSLSTIEGAPRPTFIRKPYRLNELVEALNKEIRSGLTSADLRGRQATS